MLLNILCRSANFTGPEDVTSLVASVPMLGPTKFPALKGNKVTYIFKYKHTCTHISLAVWRIMINSNKVPTSMPAIQ